MVETPAGAIVGLPVLASVGEVVTDPISSGALGPSNTRQDPSSVRAILGLVVECGEDLAISNPMVVPGTDVVETPAGGVVGLSVLASVGEAVTDPISPRALGPSNTRQVPSSLTAILGLVVE